MKVTLWRVFPLSPITIKYPNSQYQLQNPVNLCRNPAFSVISVLLLVLVRIEQLRKIQAEQYLSTQARQLTSSLTEYSPSIPSQYQERCAASCLCIYYSSFSSSRPGTGRENTPLYPHQFIREKCGRQCQSSMLEYRLEIGSHTTRPCRSVK